VKILNIGSIAFDSIKTPFGQAKKTLGGSATYFSLAASFFAQPAIVAVVGEDFNNAHKKVFQNRKVDLSGLEHKKGESFFWSGKYNFDLNTRKTLKLKLNVFADFQPKLLPHHCQSQYVFLGNIHPKLQMQVLKQIKQPRLVGLDTVDFWIERNLGDLKQVLKLVDVFVINDSEARELSREYNLVKAAKKILGMMSATPSLSPSPLSASGRGKTLIIKQGEHGLLMFYKASSLLLSPSEGRVPECIRGGERLNKKFNESNLKIFNLPGYPLETVFDPTGAGDSFAGGFMGYLASADKLDEHHLKRACVYGSVVASFCVEDFGTKRLEKLTKQEIQNRFAEFKRLTHFEIE
jgi:sugar/nucleoside kinase (ribokinase family)